VHMAGSEIEVDSCPSRIRRPYKTTGFTPRVPCFASSPSRPQPPPPLTCASCTYTASAIKLTTAFFPMLLLLSQWTQGTNPTSLLSA
jgi:hypothetical protein